MTLEILVFRLVEVLLFLKWDAKRPVPSDTTHSRGVLGHKHLDSWTANAVGLLISRPPSWAQNRTSAVLENPFTNYEWASSLMPRAQPAQPINWHLKPQKLSRSSTVNRQHFRGTSEENKKKRSMVPLQCCLQVAVVFSSTLIFFPSFLHNFSQNGFDIEQPPRSAFALDP